MSKTNTDRGMQVIESEATEQGQVNGQAWISYKLQTTARGTIAGVCETNDNLDKGYETEHASWPVSYSDAQEMRKSTGGCHSGISGINVLVYLDGARVEA